MPNPAVGMIGASLGGSAIQAGAASKAASAQAGAARAQQDVALQQQDRSLEFLAPYRDAGIPATNALQFLMGVGERPTFGGGTPDVTVIPGGTVGGSPGPTMPYFNLFSDGGREQAAQWRANNPGYNAGTTSPERYGVGDQVFDTREQADAFAAANPVGGTPYAGFEASPGYEFARNEGMRAVESGAAARGGLYSGATAQALQERGTGLARQDYQNYLSNMFNLSGLGANAASGSATVAQNAGTQQMNALANYGDARASGAIGVGNAFAGGINNGLNIWAYQNHRQ